MKRIIGIGNALVDALVTLDDERDLMQFNLPKGSMQLINSEQYAAIQRSLITRSPKYSAGGAAANTMKALGKLGMRPGYIGKVGTDATAQLFADSCRDADVQAALISAAGQTGVASTFITEDGQRTFATYLGVAASLTADDLVLELFTGYDCLYLEGYLVQNHDLVRRAVELAKQAELQIALDMGSYNIVAADKAFFTELITDSVNIVFANEDEAAAFTGKQPEEALQELAAVCDIAVVKVGARGAYAQRADVQAFAPALAVDKVVDTTGAGDFFAAGFLFELLNGSTLHQSLQKGSQLANRVIQVYGTTLAEAVWDDINLTTN